MAHPIYHNHGETVNRFLTLEECKTCAEPVVAFVEQCAAHDTHVLFDCHYPLCMFTTEQLSRLRAAQPDSPPPFTIDCCWQVTVKPDLTVFACFATGALFSTRSNRIYGSRTHFDY